MKSRLLIGLLTCSGLGMAPAITPAAEADQEAWAAEAKAIIQEFASQLQGELGAAIKSGGPVEAIQVCEERAPAIAAGLSAETGWQVGRTSLKPRNAETNTPDTWEAEVLRQFESRQAAGEDVQTMAHAEVIEDEEGQRFRFMKAVPTAGVCLNCHGTDIDPAVAAALDAAYPNDQARGYEVGDIRGAFTLEKPL